MNEQRPAQKLTPAMMKIADNPSDPWLYPYLKDQGYPAFKFNDQQTTSTRGE